MAAARLYEVGRRDLVFLGDLEGAEERQRWRGFETEARRRGVASVRQVPAAIDHNGGYRAASGLVAAAAQGFDGVFARNDMVAMGAIRALERAGKDVPRDVSVVGYDDIPMAASFSPALTTVAQDSLRAGEALASRIIDLIDGRAVGSFKLPTTLSIRESCGPRPESASG